MTWCSRNSTSPGFFLASSTIRCRFVNRLAGFMPPPVSPATGSLHAAPPFPPAGSRRAQFPRSQQYYEGATTSHPRICGHLWIRFRSPPDPSCFVFAAALLQGRRSLPGPGFVCSGRPPFRLLSCGREWDLSGLQAILPVPLLRSSTPVEPTCPRHLGHIDAAPALRTTKASATAFRGSLTQLRHPLSYASRFVLPLTRKARFRLAGSPLPGGRRTLWIAMRGFSSYSRSSPSPVLLTLAQSLYCAVAR